MSATSNGDHEGRFGGICEKERCVRMKRFLLLATLAVGTIVAWHIYEQYFAHKKGDDESEVEHDIVYLTKALYELETQKPPLPYSVSFQGHTKPVARDDRATQPLFQIRHDLLNADPGSTINLMRRLFDNYELDVNVVEHETPEEKQEQLDFLQAVLQTETMKQTMRFLVRRGLVAEDNKAQLQLLKEIWFMPYSRSKGRLGSSGFEHVFLAEIKDDSVIGLHNWVYFAEQEAQGALDYKGFLDRLELDKNKYVLATRFSFHERIKPYNTLFVGTTPEFEMSLYTVCFLLHVEQPCPIQLGSTYLSINTNARNWNGKKTLAAAFPNIKWK